mmetsp:Transcript_8747/g.15039  ORF Transcript_8747/g.15039 Transcript_8747/m.15039 type:complete len:407 (-) Transcript_8747:912-2132(-)
MPLPGVWERPRESERASPRESDTPRSLSSPPSISASSVVSRCRLRPSRDFDLVRARATAAVGSIPMEVMCVRIVAVLDTRSLSILRATFGALSAVAFALRCFEMIFCLRRLISPRSSCSSSSRSDSSSSMATVPSSSASRCSSSSSRSNSSSFASMSGSIKSSTLWPSRISGMMSYFQSSFSRSYFLRKSALYAPAPPNFSCKSFSVSRLSPAARLARISATSAGIQAGRDSESRGVGMATWIRFSTSCALFPLSFISTRDRSSISQASCLTLLTLSSVRTLIVGIEARSPATPSIWSASMPSHAAACMPRRSSLSSSASAEMGTTSVLLQTIIRGLFANRGLMLWNRAACCLIEYPHSSEISTRYMTHARKCASAVILCISIVLRSSKGRSRIPGVSMTCQRRYL